MSPPEHLRPGVPDETARDAAPDVSIRFAPGTENTLKRAAIIFAIALLGAFALVKGLRLIERHSLAKSAQTAFAAPLPVDVAVVRPTTAGQDLVLPGQTAAWYETTIYARVGGYVARWSADIGDHVKKGQVLALLETPELDAQLAAARAQLQASRAQLVARQAELDFSRSTNERWRDSPKGVVSEQERQSKRADFESAQARLYAANAQVALDKARVDQYTTMAQFKQVIAPFDGTITERGIDVGNLVTAGSTSSTTALYRITQNDPLRVFVEVPQSAADDLMQPGTPAEIRLVGHGDAFAGKTTRSSESISAQARTMRVEVDMPNPQHALLPGTYVNVAFRLPARGQVQVPAAALIYRSNGTQVARVDSDGKVAFEKVVIARDDGDMVELASGASAGDRLVLNISSQVVAGQRVRVTDEEAQTPPRQALLK